MNARRHVVVFARAPRLGAVKRRLAAGVGDMAAWRFYRECCSLTLRRLGGDPRWQCWLAVTPDAFARRGRFWPNEMPRLPQGAGDLGQRMTRALAVMPPGPVIIVGSDIPELTAGRVATAFAALGDADAVFGPASDGGFWLAGFRHRPPGFDPFRGVRWSGPHALADTRANLDGRMRVRLVDELEDVDEAGALARWRRGVI